MNRNPFKKEDFGCSFFCFLGMFACLQAAFGYLYLRVAFNIDFGSELKLIAKAKGYTFNETDKHMYPRPSNAYWR